MNVSKKTLVFAFFALAVSSLAANDATLSNLQAINTQVQQTVQTGVGGWMKFVIGWLPVLVAFGMGVGTLIYNMKKSDQSQENDYLKIGLWTFAFFFIGGVLGYAIDAIIGASLLGNAACGTEVFTTYWKESLGILTPGANHYNCS